MAGYQLRHIRNQSLRGNLHTGCFAADPLLRPIRKRRGKFMEYSQIRNTLLLFYGKTPAFIKNRIKNFKKP